MTKTGTDSFQAAFNYDSELTTNAPGRVNLIGEHTDYNNGFVLPTAIPQRTYIGIAKRNDQIVRVHSTNISQTLQYTLGYETQNHNWLDYIQGITHVLKSEGLKIGGFDAVIDSDVPLGSGLSSSAALLVAVFRALRELYFLPIDNITIARWSQRAENDFVGARVGIMDQMACSLADIGTALFLDCRNLEFKRVSLPENAELIVMHSGIEHDHAAGHYNTRRAECEQACKLLGITSLRDLTTIAQVNTLPELYQRRARHVMTENARVLETVKAMRANDLERIGTLFYASHDSMRDDYQVSLPEIDLLVELARTQVSVFGARLTGGGFGGSVVMLAEAGHGRVAGQAIAAQYKTQTQKMPKLLTP